MKKIYLKTYGCQMNVYDSDKIIELLKPMGYETTNTPEDADLYVLNTCHIREKAEHKVFSELGRIRDYPKKEKIIVVAGCVAQAEGEEIKRQAPYVDIVVGPQSYHLLPQMLRSKGKDWINTNFPPESKFDFLPIPEKSAVSAFLSIQEGCDKFCTYCVVPYTRGAEYSRSVKSIMDEAKKLVDGGAKEITLLGQNVNAYLGEHRGKKEKLGFLISQIAQIPDLERIRYTTSHPIDMDDELIQVHGSEAKLMPFLHLPVQSGNNRVLKAMNRHHSIDLYLEKIDKLRKACGHIAFSSDFIVGFPGETEEEFEDTLDLIKTVKFAQGYSFVFSPRPGTPAALMDQELSREAASQRLEKLQALLKEQQRAFNQSVEGKILPVLFEKRGRHANQWVGKTPYMQSVYVESDNVYQGDTIACLMEKSDQNSIRGKITP
jgi:tRNA-2-methylthio-N6-dimethylallyladenosine synthase